MYADLKDKVVLVTGAAGNLGSAVARYFDDLGAKLALADRKKELFERAFGAAIPENWLLCEADITDKESVAAMVAEVTGKFGRIDVLINIAGGYRGGNPIYQTDEEMWDFMMNLNARSVFLVSGAVAKVMVEQGTGGRIISIGAKPGLEGTKNHTAYSASKAAVLRLTESMAKELKPHGINVNSVIPSTLDTPQNREAMPDTDFKKWVAPASLAGVLAFLASEASRDISGAHLPVYGGSL